ncbi:ABC transporter permease [Fredinandcohnia humi]
MKKNYLLLIGILMFLGLVAAMIASPFVVSETDLDAERMRFYEDGSMARAPFPPLKDDLLGTDQDGRSLGSLILIGTKDTLIIIFSITLIRYLISIPLALLGSEKKGTSHWIITMLHTFFSAIPTLIAAIIFINLPFLIFSTTRFIWAIFILAFIEVGRTSHLFQQQAHDLSQKEFIRVAIVQGNSQFGLIFRHYIPYMLPNIVSNFFVDLGRVTVLIGQLGLFSIFVSQKFVELDNGFGELQNTSHNWATLLGETRYAILSAPWIPIVPALALFYAMLTFNIIGEGLRRRFSKTAQYL